MTGELYHEAVMAEEAIEAMSLEPSGTYVDVTFGGGGHSKRILEGLGEEGRLIAFDRDEDAPGSAMDDPRFRFFRADFRYAKNLLRYYGELPVDGILADLGVSSHHFDTAERGFSTRFDGPLDMRMDPEAPFTAAMILEGYREEELSRLFKEYGELKQARKIARRVVEEREKDPIETTGRLRELLSGLFPPDKKESHFARVFQALRIEVNQELEALEDLLSSSPDLLRTGARLVVLSYHSLEDRLVKRFMQYGTLSGTPQKDEKGGLIRPLRPVTRKPITPTEEELESNPRARSAKLRVAERIEG